MSKFLRQELIRIMQQHAFVAVVVDRRHKRPIWSWHGDSSLECLTERISERLREGCQVVFYDREEIDWLAQGVVA